MGRTSGVITRGGYRIAAAAAERMTALVQSGARTNHPQLFARPLAFCGVYMYDNKLYKRIKARSHPTSNGCWIWDGCTNGRYGWVHSDRRSHQAHRLMWEAVHGPIAESLCVLHRCDIPLCVNPEHLFLGSQSDNVHDMIQKGRKAFLGGAKGPGAKMTEEMVVAIRRDKQSPARIYAERFGVTLGAVNKARRGYSWKCVSWERVERIEGGEG